MTTIQPTAPVISPEHLRELREQAGLSQREVAALAGCSLAFVANCEGGYIPRRSPTLRRVLVALDEVLTQNERPVATPDARENGEAAPHDAA